MISRDVVDDEQNQKMILAGTVIASLGLVLAGFAGGYYGDTILGDTVSRAEAGDMIAGVLSNSSGSDVSVVDVEERSGLYRVQVSSGNNQLQTVYVTKDGDYYTTALNNLTSFRRTVALQASTRSCLNSRNVTMYGNLSQRATQLQIRIMGGTQNVAGYYQDVRQPRVLQTAARSGVRRVPAFVSDGRVLSGVNSLSEVRKFAGCGR